MFRKFIRHITRPLLGEQSTARLAYQPYQGLALSGVNGNGGQGVRRTINATSTVTFSPGPTTVVRDPTVTGNPSSGLQLQALSDDMLTQVVSNAKQF
jgi:hypothetical protein